jgi:hypothetical protein
MKLMRNAASALFSRGHGGAGLCNEDIAAGLVFVSLDGDWLQIFGFEDLLAIEAFHIVHTVAAGDDYGSVVLAGCLHTKRPEIRIILTRHWQVSRGGEHIPILR